jgi:hypothetical protein
MHRQSPEPLPLATRAVALLSICIVLWASIAAIIRRVSRLAVYQLWVLLPAFRESASERPEGAHKGEAADQAPAPRSTRSIVMRRSVIDFSTPL